MFVNCLHWRINHDNQIRGNKSIKSGELLALAIGKWRDKTNPEVIAQRGQGNFSPLPRKYTDSTRMGIGKKMVVEDDVTICNRCSREIEDKESGHEVERSFGAKW